MSIPPIEDYRQAIEDALAYASGTYSFDDIAAGVAAGTMQYWAGINSIIITEIIDYPQKRVLHFFLAGGGDLAELEEMTPPIIEWGRKKGCTTAQMIGRKGWERTFLTRTGWEPTLQMYEREL